MSESDLFLFTQTLLVESGSVFGTHADKAPQPAALRDGCGPPGIWGGLGTSPTGPWKQQMGGVQPAPPSSTG